MLLYKLFEFETVEIKLIFKFEVLFNKDKEFYRNKKTQQKINNKININFFIWAPKNKKIKIK